MMDNLSLLPRDLILVISSLLDPPSRTTLYFISTSYRFLSDGISKKKELCCSAAEYGHLSILSWGRDVLAPWNKEVCYAAARYDRLECLKWLTKNGCDVDCAIVIHAIRGGSIPVVEWIKYKHCHYMERFSSGSGLCTEAAKNGHLEMIEWLISECGQSCDARIPDAAARYGYLEILKWCRKNQVPIDRNWIVECAAEGGHVHVLEYLLKDDHCNHSILIFDCAAMKGHLNIMEWYMNFLKERELGVIKHMRVCSAAASNGHLEVLQWCHNNGFPWCSRTALFAARNRHLNTLSYAVENGCPWYAEECLLACSNNVKMQIWIRERDH